MQRHVDHPERGGAAARSRAWSGLIAGMTGVVIFGLTLPMTHFALAGFDRYFVGIVCAAVGYAQSGMLAREMGGWQVISWALVFGLPAMILCTWLLAGPIDWQAPASAWAGFVYVSLMSQFFGFFFWNRGMALAGVAKTGQLQLLQPFVTLAASIVLLGEAVGWRHAGFALAVVAIVTIGRQLRVERPGGV